MHEYCKIKSQGEGLLELGPKDNLILIAVLFGMIIATIGWQFLLQRKLNAISHILDKFTKGTLNNTIEQMIVERLNNLESETERINNLDIAINSIQKQLDKSIQRVGFLKYNPFNEVGGEQSFVVTLLDEEGNGVLINSLHGRAGTRIYAKSIFQGQTNASLSYEEGEALKKALDGGYK